MAALAPFPAGFTRPARDPDWKQCSVPAGDEILVYRPIARPGGLPPADGVVYAVALEDPAGHRGRREIFRGPIGQAWDCWLQAGGVPE